MESGEGVIDSCKTKKVVSINNEKNINKKKDKTFFEGKTKYNVLYYNGWTNE